MSQSELSVWQHVLGVEVSAEQLVTRTERWPSEPSGMNVSMYGYVNRPAEPWRFQVRFNAIRNQRVKTLVQLFYSYLWGLAL